MFYGLKKPKKEGEEMYWVFSPLSSKWGSSINSNQIVHGKVRKKLIAKYISYLNKLCWVTQEGRVLCTR